MTTYPRADHPIVVEFSPADLRARLYEALGVYVTAMGYPRGTEHHRAPMWTEHTSRPGWRAFGAIAAGSEADPGALVAIAYGYHGTAHQWWHQQVLGGMRRAGWTEQSAKGLLGDYFEVTELHVHPQAQGHGLGAALLTRLLDGLNRTVRAVVDTGGRGREQPGVATVSAVRVHRYRAQLHLRRRQPPVRGARQAAVPVTSPPVTIPSRDVSTRDVEAGRGRLRRRRIGPQCPGRRLLSGARGLVGGGTRTRRRARRGGVDGRALPRLPGRPRVVGAHHDQAHRHRRGPRARRRRTSLPRLRSVGFRTRGRRPGTAGVPPVRRRDMSLDRERLRPARRRRLPPLRRRVDPAQQGGAARVRRRADRGAPRARLLGPRRAQRRRGPVAGVPAVRGRAARRVVRRRTAQGGAGVVRGAIGAADVGARHRPHGRVRGADAHAAAGTGDRRQRRVGRRARRAAALARRDRHGCRTR